MARTERKVRAATLHSECCSVSSCRRSERHGPARPRPSLRPPSLRPPPEPLPPPPAHPRPQLTPRPLLRLPVPQVHKVGGPHRRKSTAARRGTGPAGGGESPSRCPPRQLPPRMRPPTAPISYTSQSAAAVARSAPPPRRRYRPGTRALKEIRKFQKCALPTVSWPSATARALLSPWPLLAPGRRTCLSGGCRSRVWCVAPTPTVPRARH